jgi:hypothetical protein
VLIGNGSAAQAQYFRTRVLKLPEVPAAGEPLLYTDPSLATFKAAGLKHGALRTFSPAGLGPTVRAWREGFRQRSTMGQPWQQGGALVLAKGGQILWSYASDDPGDHAPVAKALAALPQ